MIDWLEPGPVTYQNDKERNVTFEGNFAQIGGTAVDVRLLTGMAASKCTDAKGDKGFCVGKISHRQAHRDPVA